MSNTIISLLTNNYYAERVITRYCDWNNAPIPFTTFNREDRKMYATSKALRPLTTKQSWLKGRSNNTQFYKDLGSLLLIEDSLRGTILEDDGHYGLTRLWLHNASSVAAIFLTSQPLFNSFVNSDIRRKELAPRYGISYLSQLYTSYLEVETDVANAA